MEFGVYHVIGSKVVCTTEYNTSAVQATYWGDQAKLTTREQLENGQFD